MSEDDFGEILARSLGIRGSQDAPATLERAKQAFLARHDVQLRQVQDEAIAPVLAGEDTLIISSTASGKTEAAMIPIAARLLSFRPRPLCVYVAPTKALLNNLVERLEVPLHRLGLGLAVRHGDSPQLPEGNRIQVLLTTPESLDVLLSTHVNLLKKTQMVVLDEIHQIYGTPRGMHIMFLLGRLNRVIGHHVQRVALSATIGDPIDLSWWLAQDSPCFGPLARPEKEQKIVQIRDARPIDAALMSGGSDAAIISEVIDSSDTKKMLVFVNSRRRCDELSQDLRAAVDAEVFVHYSTLELEDRSWVEQRFQTVERGICVATTTLELGIDIGSVDMTVLAEPPASVSSFLQRIGRGGRRAGTSRTVMIGHSVAGLLQHLALLSLAQQGLVETAVPWASCWSVLVQQIFSLLTSKARSRAHTSEFQELAGSIDQEYLRRVLSRLCGTGHLIDEPAWNSFMIGDELQQLVNRGEVYGNIGEKGGGISLLHRGRSIGTVPIPMSQIQPGVVILFAGRYWRVTHVFAGSLSVEPSQRVPSPVKPRWRGGAPALSFEVAQEMRRLLFGAELVDGVRADAASELALEGAFDRAGLCGRDVPVISEQVAGRFRYHTFAGGRVNSVLRALFASQGEQCELSRDLGGIALDSTNLLRFSALPASADQVEGLLQSRWEGLAGLAETGPFYDLLPPSIQKAEILGQVLSALTLSNLEGLLGADPVGGTLDLVAEVP